MAGAWDLLVGRNVCVEFIVTRADGEGEIRFLIWGGLLSKVIYTWSKYRTLGARRGFI